MIYDILYDMLYDNLLNTVAIYITSRYLIDIAAHRWQYQSFHDGHFVEHQIKKRLELKHYNAMKMRPNRVGKTR